MTIIHFLVFQNVIENIFCFHKHKQSIQKGTCSLGCSSSSMSGNSSFFTSCVAVYCNKNSALKLSHCVQCPKITFTIQLVSIVKILLQLEINVKGCEISDLTLSVSWLGLSPVKRITCLSCNQKCLENYLPKVLDILQYVLNVSNDLSPF